MSGTPSVSATPTTLAQSDDKSDTWGPLLDVQPDVDNSKVYYRSFVRRSVEKVPRGQRKGEAVETVQRFGLGDGVLVAVLGNDVGVGILTHLWEEPAPEPEETDDQSYDEDKEQDKRIKLCEIRWFYRKQDLPTTMNTLFLADVSVDDAR